MAAERCGLPIPCQLKSKKAALAAFFDFNPVLCTAGGATASTATGIVQHVDWAVDDKACPLLGVVDELDDCSLKVFDGLIVHQYVDALRLKGDVSGTGFFV